MPIMKTILQASKLAPRFLFQIYFEPSRVYDFINTSKTYTSLYIRSALFQGLLLGFFSAIPHYFWYKNAAKSILFTIVIAGAVAIAGVVAFAIESENAAVVAGVFVAIVAIAGLSAGPKADASVIAFADAIAVAFAIAVAVAGVATYVSEDTFVDSLENTSQFNYMPFIFTGVYLFIVIYSIAYSIESNQIKNFETIIPITFIIGYIVASALKFTKNKRKFSSTFNVRRVIKHSDLVSPRFEKVQALSLFWGPLFSLLTILPTHLNGNPESFSSLLIIAIGFLILPLFTLRIPDYLLCLSVWHRQRKRILRQTGTPKEMIRLYEVSLPFKYEMLYYPLPGLHKIMAAIADNQQFGIEEATKQITRLYLFTFQQEQVLTALKDLLRDKKERGHLIIHYLLEAKNVPILEDISKEIRLAKLYLELFENDYAPQQLKNVRLAFEKEEGYHLNAPMIRSLAVVHKLLTATGLKDIHEAASAMAAKQPFPGKLEYFKVLENTITNLVDIKNALIKAVGIERFDTKRSVLAEQQEQLVYLSKSVSDKLYEPFSAIWQKALGHCAGLVQKEIDLLQGSAVFEIHLLNRVILTNPDQHLHFDIRNTGQELGRDVCMTLHTDGGSLTVTAQDIRIFDFFETDQTKRITFPISILHPGKATVKLSLIYSDRTRENKQETFSFPVIITEQKTQFKKIENPYIAGPALRSDSPLFIGRDDIYQFIDQNIIPAGQPHTIVCHGHRRTGKSSLLHYIEQQGFTDPRLVPINTDIQGIQDEKDFFLTLSERIIKKLNLPSASAVEDFGGFKRFVEGLSSGGNDKIIVFLIDEFEALQMLVEDQRISRTVFSNIRHLMQYADNLIFLFCGTHKIEEMTADYWSIFFNTALYRRIGRLPKKDAVRLIKEPVKNQLDYDDLAVEQILSMSGRQPYLIQLICRTMVNQLNDTKKRNDALVNDVDDAVEQIIAENNDNFSKETWKAAGHLERMILSATAEELTHKHLEHIHIEEILAKIAPLIPGFSRDAALDTLDKLVTGEILSERNQNYCFTVNMMRRRLAVRHPLRKVRG